MADPTVNIILRATDQTKGVIGGISSALGGLGKIALGAAAGGLAALGAGLALSVKEAMDAQSIQAQLEQVLKSTGGAAGVTAEMANDLATNLSEVTRFSDDAVIGGENLLLTFTGIGKDVFPQVTETMLDMSTAMGTDLKSSAIQLGKALNDPAQGMSALTRVGVNFTDSQKKLVEQLVKAGKVEEAQKVILDELQKEFGGSAKAAGQTFAGQLDILKNSLLNVAEGVGTVLLPILSDLIKNVIMPALPIIQTLGAALGDALSGDLGLAADDLREGLAGLVPQPVIDALANLVLWVRDSLLPALAELGNWLATVGIPALLEFAATVWSQLGPGLAQLVVWIQDLAAVALPILQQAIGFVVDNWQIFAGIAAVVGAVILALNAPIVAIGAAIVLFATAWANNWGGIRDTLTAIWNDFLLPVFTILKDTIDKTLPVALDYLAKFWTNVLQPAIQAVWSWMSTVLLPFLRDVVYPWLKENIPKAIQTLSDFWLNTLLPAITKVWNWIYTVLIPFFRDTVVPWLQKNIPAAIQTLSDFWNNTLLPAITAVWNFINTYLVPIFNEIKGIMEIGLKLAITALQGAWENVLLPALKNVWKYFNENILPILKDVKNFIETDIGPKISWFKTAVIDPLASSISGLATGALQWLLTKLQEFKDLLSKITLPPWLVPGSPTPFELGIRGITAAIGELNRAQLPQFSANLRSASSAAGELAGNTNNYNLTIQSSAPANVVQDFAMLRALAGV